MSTKIEWCEETWNPTAGCSKISSGCDNCFAEIMARRLAHMPHSKEKYQLLTTDGKWNGNMSIEHRELKKPYSWKKPRMVFVSSMGDLFHENMQYEWQNEVFRVMEENPRHTFLLLTKRADRMADFSARYGVGCFPKNIWWGVTVENQKMADERIPHLLTIDAPVRFLSVEPMLGAIDIEAWLNDEEWKLLLSESNVKAIKGINWVIAGGESGHRARPLHPDWIRSLRDQCKEADVPFFFKQWGEWSQVGVCGNDDDSKYYNAKNCQRLNIAGNQGYHGRNAIYVQRVGKKKSGSRLDNQEYKEYPKG